ncbi:hypothetical protein I7I50_11099 [Histoplasma capsulatum G186AR]|uniref:Uncharacterized protein n=1 Tax=Ajellomyces capsulatus TaxID=5037 RepID=A0A8H8D7Y0_AJECA|nr:hypothetical protein I7I52_02338 [Histoplasma capsulatum]QSS69710.1 hypothetical protein I7I50_11099 [Histoplasma capsulatum G186AR]
MWFDIPFTFPLSPIPSISSISAPGSLATSIGCIEAPIIVAPMFWPQHRAIIVLLGSPRWISCCIARRR